MNIICIQISNGQIHYVDFTTANQKYYTFCEKFYSKNKVAVYSLDNHIAGVCKECVIKHGRYSGFELYNKPDHFRTAQSYLLTLNVDKYHDTKYKDYAYYKYDNLMNHFWQKLKKIKRQYNAIKK